MRGWLAAVLCVCSAPALAQSLDEALEGFGQDASAAPAATSPAMAPVLDRATGEVTGSVSLAGSYNYRDHETANGTDWQGLSKLRSRLNLQYDQRLSEAWQIRIAGYGFYDSAYGLRDRGDYSEDVLDDYEHEADWQEVWLRGKLRDDVDMKIGRQVVNWGRADSLRVLDVLNPLDNREPGLTDIEDIRLPVTMLKTDWFITSQWQASLIAIPEMRFSKNPPYGSDFSVPFSPLTGGPAVVLREDRPEHVADTAFAAAVTGTFSGWDISLHAAHLWRDTPYLRVGGPYTLAAPLTALQQLSFEHSSMDMLGAGANLIRGSWLFKGELAWFDGVDYTLAAPTAVAGFGWLDLPVANAEKNRLDMLVGVEYFGIANTSLALELANRHIADFDVAMEPLFERRDRLETALRYTGNFIHDQLEVTALAVALGERAQDGSMLRLQAAYDLRDALVLTVGVVDYRHGDLPPFTIAENNDRLFAELKYSF